MWCTNLAPRGDVGKGGPATPGFPAWGGLGVTRTGWAACGPTSGVEILICSFARERAVARAGEPVQLPASGRVAGLGPIARGRVHLTDQPRDGPPHGLGWFTDEPAGHRVNRALPGSGPARAGRKGQALESANAGQGGGVGRGEQPDNPLGTATQNPRPPAGVLCFHLLINAVRFVFTCYKWGMNTELHKVVSRGDVELARLLLEQGADPNARDDLGCTPLHEAALTRSVELASLLLAHGADPNAEDNWENTPLHDAARARAVNIVRLLLDHGADPNRYNVHDETPLAMAASRGVPELVQLLLERGARPNVRDRCGFTPLRLAREFGKSDSVVRLLLEHGAVR